MMHRLHMLSHCRQPFFFVLLSTVPWEREMEGEEFLTLLYVQNDNVANFPDKHCAMKMKIN